MGVTQQEDRVLKIENRDIAVTNPDKLLFPEVSLSKWDFVLHIVRLAPFMLPYCRDRLLTTIRFPDGVGGKSFYQKNKPDYAPEWVQSQTSDNTEYILLQDTATLVWLATQAALEFHPSFHLAGDERPTELVFDLDPTVEGFAAVTEVALALRESLRSLGLTGVAKTSGATGLQIYVPIEQGYTFAQTRKVGKFLAEYLEAEHPRLVTLERLKRDRGTKVYIDYLQHWRGKTLIAPYSPRAREMAPVSTPVLWRELEQGIQPNDFNLINIHRRLSQIGDLFAPVRSASKQTSLDNILSFINS